MTPRLRAARQPPEKRRALLLQAARTCLSKHGLRGFTLKNIADEGGVSVGLINHYYDGVEDLLQAVFNSVMFELPSVGAGEPQDLETAITSLRDVVEKNFAPGYYSRENLLIWLPIYEEMVLNPKRRRSLGKQDQKYVDKVARHIAAVARFRDLTLDAPQIAYDFLAFLDGLWLRWCLSARKDTRREKEAALRFLEYELGPLR